MTDYNVPTKDINFAIKDVLDFGQHYAELPGCEAATPDMVDAILEEAASFVEREVAPLHRVGDEHGCNWSDGEVSTPPGFKDAYGLYTENGWAGLAQPEEEGGQGLPPSLGAMVMEMAHSANHPWTMYPGLSLGAIRTTREYGPDDLKTKILGPMVEGRWTGTMCLTEAHSGSDLGLLSTKAQPNGDGTHSITGSKIFISSGEHDMAENIIHIVLARLPDAPSGIKGISLFLVPKLLISDDGSLGGSNGVSCGSIEHKMGIHGNSTCVMNFDGSCGYLLGEPNRGMSQMFTFINESRLMVAQQAHGAIERSFQGALEYARERHQMRSPVRRTPEKPADPIVYHPDVRRMLMTQKAFSIGGRLLNFYCAQHIDREHFGDDPLKSSSEASLALLTPIAKGFLSEVANEAASYGIQVLGGHGYVSEWGMEQVARDVRITTLYEGTTGIQGLDLLGRKVLGTGGSILEPFVQEVFDFVETASEDGDMTKTLDELAAKTKEWIDLSRYIGEASLSDPDEINAAAYDYLMFSGYVVVGYFLARAKFAALTSLAAEDHTGVIDAANFYYQRILPRTLTLAVTIRSGAASVPELA